MTENAQGKTTVFPRKILQKGKSMFSFRDFMSHKKWKIKWENMDFPKKWLFFNSQVFVVLSFLFPAGFIRFQFLQNKKTVLLLSVFCRV